MRGSTGSGTGPLRSPYSVRRRRSSSSGYGDRIGGRLAEEGGQAAGGDGRLAGDGGLQLQARGHGQRLGRAALGVQGGVGALDLERALGADGDAGSVAGLAGARGSRSSTCRRPRPSPGRAGRGRGGRSRRAPAPPRRRVPRRRRGPSRRRSRRRRSCTPRARRRRRRSARGPPRTARRTRARSRPARRRTRSRLVRRRRAAHHDGRCALMRRPWAGGLNLQPGPAWALEPVKEPRHARMRPSTLRRIATRTLGNPRRIPFGFVRRPARSTDRPRMAGSSLTDS